MNPFAIITKPLGCVLSLVGAVAVLALLVVFAGWFGVGLVADGIVEEHFSEHAPGQTEVEGVRFKPFKCELEVDNLRVMNPDPFPEEPMLRIDRAAFDTTWQELFAERAEGDVIEIENAEIAIERISLLTLGDRANLDGLSEAWGSLFGEVDGEPQLTAYGHPLQLNSLTIRIEAVEIGTAQGGKIASERFSQPYVRTFSEVTSWRPVLETIADDLRDMGRRNIANAIDPDVDLTEQTAEDFWRRGVEGVRDILGN
ncbi:MAG: hypothetical protein ACFB21_13010 [Opitutales bacterium]